MFGINLVNRSFIIYFVKRLQLAVYRNNTTWERRVVSAVTFLWRPDWPARRSTASRSGESWLGFNRRVRESRLRAFRVASTQRLIINKRSSHCKATLMPIQRQ